MKKKPVNPAPSATSKEPIKKLAIPKGMGQPLFRSYIYPYAPAETGMAGGAGGTKTGLGRGSETPLFVVDTYPYSSQDASETKPTAGPTPDDEA